MANLDKAKVSQFRSDFDTVAKLFETKYGLKLRLGTIRYDATSLRCTLSALVADPVGEAAVNVTPSVPAVVTGAPVKGDGFGDYVSTVARSGGYSIEISAKGFIGSKYKMPGKRVTYTVTGINPRAPKFCVEVKTESGARYRMPVAALRTAVLVGHE